MRRRLQEEETSGEENASEGVSRTRKPQECPWGKAPGGACYRRTLQEKEAPGGRGSRYRRLHEMGLHKEALGGKGSRSKKLQADLPPGGSRRRRLL